MAATFDEATLVKAEKLPILAGYRSMHHPEWKGHRSLRDFLQSGCPLVACYFVQFF